jgi:hypothetical protein
MDTQARGHEFSRNTVSVSGGNGVDIQFGERNNYYSEILGVVGARLTLIMAVPRTTKWPELCIWNFGSNQAFW